MLRDIGAVLGVAIVEMGRFIFLNSFKICSRRTTVYVQAPPPWNVPPCSTPYSRIIARNALRFLFLANHRLIFSAHISSDGNALCLSYRTNKTRKLKTRNASRFRWLTLVELGVTVQNPGTPKTAVKLLCDCRQAHSITRLKSGPPTCLLHFIILMQDDGAWR
jgi:hypothetical protein